MNKLWILSIFAFFSCSTDEQKLFDESLEDFSKEYPIFLMYMTVENGIKERVNCSYPSYHAYFMTDSLGEKKLRIVRSLSFSKFTVNRFGKSRLKGFFIYKDKNPVIVIDEDNISDDYIGKELNHNIPDSLKLGYNCDFRYIQEESFESKDYKLR